MYRTHVKSKSQWFKYSLLLVYFFHAVKHFCSCNTKYWFGIPTVWSKLVSIAGTSDIHIHWKWYHEPGYPYSNCIPSLTELNDTLNNQYRCTDVLSYINYLFYLASSYRHGQGPYANLLTIGSSRWLRGMFPYRKKWSFKAKFAKSHSSWNSPYSLHIYEIKLEPLQRSFKQDLDYYWLSIRYVITSPLNNWCHARLSFNQNASHQNWWAKKMSNFFSIPQNYWAPQWIRYTSIIWRRLKCFDSKLSPWNDSKSLNI